MRCIICSNEVILKNQYYRCTNCHHEYKENVDDSEIINDILDESLLKKKSKLDKFKIKIAAEFKGVCKDLIDVGSASGRFLYFAKKDFINIFGIEITPQCIDFCDRIGIPTQKVLTEGIIQSDVLITAWHSLEHIGIKFLEEIFKMLEQNLTEKSRIVISVPNSNSLMFRLFGRKAAYYDVESHYHQFSNASLRIFVEKYNFEIMKRYRSMSYTSFGYFQSFLNIFNKEHNYLYYYLKRGNIKKKGILVLLYNLFLLPVISIISIPFIFVDFLNVNNSGVITLCLKKK